LTFVNRIAVLGWGSLIWDPRPEFDRHLTGWRPGGPWLPLEFCRISESRKKALTLVIDASLGTEVETLYSLSTRSDPQDVVCDLRWREGTTTKNIGYINLITGDARGRDEKVVAAIGGWARENEIRYVIWTDLPANFPERQPDRFHEAALSHLKTLDSGALQKAVEYLVKAPKPIATGFREFLLKDEWFRYAAGIPAEGDK